jgi:pimeloyl-ACP methyl ester carboxylesterase
MGEIWDVRSAARRLLGAMLVAVYLVALLIAALVLVARPAKADALTAATGYQTTYDVYAPEGTALPIALVFLHGKNGSHESPAMRAFARSFASEGITVYLPSMPWSRKWNGTAVDAAAVVDAMVAIAAQNGRKVIVGGQSMGASFSLGWRPGSGLEGPPPAVVGKLLTSPGHMLDLFPPYAGFWKTITPSLDKAKALIAAGKGEEITRFESSNTTGANTIVEVYETRPVVYAAFHDPDVYPSLRKALPQTKLPVYWGVGSRDPAGGGKRPSFDRLPATPGNVYSEIDGDHNSIMRDALPAMVKWVKGL